ncbi:MAG: NAD(P)H-binding protein [Pseudomonadota bacterium]
MKIVFLGATGMIGNVVIQHLGGSNREVLALVRNPDIARRTLPDWVSVRRGDVKEDATLDPVESADVVIFMVALDPRTARPTGFNADNGGVDAVLRHAKRGNKPHIIYLSSLLERSNPHDWWGLNLKTQATRAVQTSGLPHTILRPSNLMENLPHRFQRGTSVTYIGTPRETAWWIAADDVGQMLKAHLNRSMEDVYDIPMQGPESLTTQEAAERYAKAAGLKVSRAPYALMRTLGFFVRELGYVASISQAMNDAPEPFQSEETWARLGPAKTSVEDFAKRATTRNH